MVCNVLCGECMEDLFTRGCLYATENLSGWLNMNAKSYLVSYDQVLAFILANKFWREGRNNWNFFECHSMVSVFINTSMVCFTEEKYSVTNEWCHFKKKKKYYKFTWICLIFFLFAEQSYASFLLYEVLYCLLSLKDGWFLNSEYILLCRRNYVFTTCFLGSAVLQIICWPKIHSQSFFVF